MRRMAIVIRLSLFRLVESACREVDGEAEWYREPVASAIIGKSDSLDR
jgi:hypothetical protein